MKINETQVQQLYNFTQAHYVEHYDLQTELVDHLANAIEDIWQEKPLLSFEEARDQSFKKFGITGFSDVITQRRKAMNKRYYKYLWRELKQWFSIPKVVITLSLFFMFYYAFTSVISGYLFLVSYVLLFIHIAYMSIQLNKQFRRRKEISNKKWLLEEMIYKQAGGIAIILISQFFNVIGYKDFIFSNLYYVIGLSLVFTLLFLINYIGFNLLPNKAEILLKETYPEYNL
ncbi:hypothetical protein [uncultured Lacinutrix sp.]|uniref:hypothetical protein n=1 Tax=uncultured Lacinutrix sp. TaxID=574032 RepID=UPI002620AB69|nr:hypothetical protein [uncultured Lacinutrix sp.]